MIGSRASLRCKWRPTRALTPGDSVYSAGERLQGIGGDRGGEGICDEVACRCGAPRSTSGQWAAGRHAAVNETQAPPGRTWRRTWGYSVILLPSLIKPCVCDGCMTAYL